MNSLILSAIFLPVVFSYSNCNSSPFPYQGRNLVFPIQQIQQTPGNGNTFPIEIKGNIRITSQCSVSFYFINNQFRIENFTYSGLGPNINDTAVWYGAIAGDSSGIYSVSLTDSQTIPITVNNTAVSVDYSFTTRAGAAVSFNDFNEFRFFTLTNQFFLARAIIPNGISIAVPGSSPSPAPATAVSPAATVSPASVPSPSPSPKAQKSAANRMLRDPYTALLIAFLSIAVFYHVF